MNRKNITRMLTFVLILGVLLSENGSSPFYNLMNRSQWMAQAAGNPFLYLPFVARQDPPALVRKVNVPLNDWAIFWFGRVTPDESYADVRVRYSSTELVVFLTAFDRRIWYNPDTSTNALNTLADWDGMALYLNLQGKDARQPGNQSYRIQVQYSPQLNNHQAVYQGNGQSWQAVGLPVSVLTGWRGNYPNDNMDDQGWAITLHIPFSSLGLSGPPPQGTTWGMALDLNNRNSLAGPSQPVKTWPASSKEIGQLAFGVPAYNSPPVSVTSAPLTIRQGINGVVVNDNMVGGSSNCGQGLDRWTQWGNANYSSANTFTIQNESDVSDFPCFSKEFLSFPLSQIPVGKVIISAHLTIHQFGNSDPTQAKDSIVHVMRVAEDWNAATVSWNTAPLALENYAETVVHPITNFSNFQWPGVPYDFDVSRALADAYREGSPLRLALYSTDLDYHSGKYFVNSRADDWNAAARPVLVVVWGDPK